MGPLWGIIYWEVLGFGGMLLDRIMVPYFSFLLFPCYELDLMPLRQDVVKIYNKISDGLGCKSKQAFLFHGTEGH